MKARIEIIEKILGDKLSAINISKIDQTLLKRIAKNLYQFDSQNGYNLPSPKEDSVCPYIHPLSSLSPLTGLTPDHFIYESNRIYPDTPLVELPPSDRMAGIINLLILFYDSICIPDPLCQCLGYPTLFESKATSSIGEKIIRENINKVLRLYADLRDLLYDESIILAPSAVWLPISGRIICPGELCDFVTDYFINQNWVTADHINEYWPTIAKDEYRRYLTANTIYHFHNEKVFESLKIANDFGYQIFFSDDLSEKIYLAYLEFLSSKLSQEPSYERLTITTIGKMIPRTDKLNRKDILSLRRNSVAFNAFRQTLSEISREIDRNNQFFEEHPGELKKYIDALVSSKLGEINGEIQRSGFLSNLLDELCQWEISVFSGITVGLILNSIESGLLAATCTKGMETFFKIIYESLIDYDERKIKKILNRAYTKILVG